jgi:small subunit ribosomal protein S14
MASKAKILKAQREPKFKVRKRNRCKLCGRPRAYYRKFSVCRICLREMAALGLVPGLRKASW